MGHQFLSKLAKDLHLPAPTKKPDVFGGLATIARNSFATTPSSASSQPSFMLYQNLNYMNISGDALKKFWSTWIPKYRTEDRWDTHLIVLHDELDLPIGSIKYRPHTRRTNGHNGLRSIASKLPIEWSDVSVGIGRPLNRNDVAKYVLSNFNNSEKAVLYREGYTQVLELVIQILSESSVDVDV